MNLEKEKCWELFSTPRVTDIGYGEVDSNTIKLQFICEKTNTCINIY